MKIGPVKLEDIAQVIRVSYKGDSNFAVTGINEIHKVEEGDITFVDVAKYYNKALNSAASVIIINSSEVEPPEGKHLIISDDPFSSYNTLVNHFKPKSNIPSGNFTKGEEVEIGNDTIIYNGVVIGSRVKIGENCTIYPNVVIYGDTIIGNDVIIQAGSIIGADAYYFKNRGHKFEKMISCGRVIIHDDVEIGALCTIDKGVSGDTIIGKGTKFDNQVHIGHGVVVGERCLIAAQVGVGGKTIIEDEVIIWGQAGITKDVRIGKKAIISAQAGVSKSLPGGKLYFGSPAQEADKAYREMAYVRMQARSKGKVED